MLRGVLKCLSDAEIDVGLDLGCEPHTVQPGRLDPGVNMHLRDVRLDSGDQTLVCQQRRKDPSSEIADGLHCLLNACLQLPREPACSLGIPLDLPLEQPKLHGKSD